MSQRLPKPMIGAAFAVLAIAAMLAGACTDATSGRASNGESDEGSGTELDDIVDQIEQEHIEIDRLVDQCMSAQGFAYIPPDRHATSASPVPTPTGPTDRGRAQAWGYGILTWLEDDKPWREVVTVDDVQRQLDALQAQSDGEAPEYSKALYGSINSAEIAYDGTGEGCLAEAIRAVNEAPGSLVALNDQFEAATKRLAADPRAIDLEATWARCMHESGHDFSRRHEIMDMLLQVSADFHERMPTVSWSVVDQGGGPVEVAPNSELVAAFEADLAREADRARKLAVADIDCFITIADDYEPIRQEYFADLDRRGS